MNPQRSNRPIVGRWDRRRPSRWCQDPVGTIASARPAVIAEPAGSALNYLRRRLRLPWVRRANALIVAVAFAEGRGR